MKKQIFRQFWLTLLSILLVSYMVLQLALNVGDIVDIEYVTYMSAVEKKEVKAYLFREETVLKGTGKGTSSYFFADGEKVINGEKVAARYSQENDASIQSRIKEINKKIEILTKSAVGAGMSTINLDKIDEQITNLQLLIIKAVDDNDLGTAVRYRDELNIISNRRQALIQSQNGYTAQINKLQDEKRTLEASFKGTSVVYTAPNPGYFYSAVDGYEELFTMEGLKNLTIAGFDDLARSVPDNSLIYSAVGKIVTNADWYIAFEVDKRTASAYNKNDKCRFSFPFSAGTNIEMTLDKKISQTDLDRVIMVFTTNSMPDGFNFTRAQTVELITNTYNGLKISVSALRMHEGKSGVFSLDGNKVIFKEAQVLYEENGYYICALPIDPQNPKNKAFVSKQSLSLYDPVIYSGRNVYVGKVLK